MADDRPLDDEALDAYSSVVIEVARTVLPSVASLAVRTSRGDGGGSASVITPDGYLLTSATSSRPRRRPTPRSPTARRSASTSSGVTCCRISLSSRRADPCHRR